MTILGSRHDSSKLGNDIKWRLNYMHALHRDALASGKPELIEKARAYALEAEPACEQMRAALETLDEISTRFTAEWS